MNRTIHKINIETPDPGYEPFPVSIMNRSTSEVMKFDPTLGKPAKISYRLNQAGCIRIRLVCRSDRSLLIKTLQDWTNQEFGRYELSWDGRDESGNIVENKKIFVLFEAKDQGNGLQHQGHDEALCKDPSLTISTVPEPSQSINGILEVKAAISEKSSTAADNSKCEVRCYIDYKLYKKETLEKIVDEYIFKIDTAALSDGEHLITVNIDDLQDHIGSAGVKIIIEN